MNLNTSIFTKNFRQTLFYSLENIFLKKRSRELSLIFQGQTNFTLSINSFIHSCWQNIPARRPPSSLAIVTNNNEPLTNSLPHFMWDLYVRDLMQT